MKALPITISITKNRKMESYSHINIKKLILLRIKFRILCNMLLHIVLEIKCVLLAFDKSSHYKFIYLNTELSESGIVWNN